MGAASGSTPTVSIWSRGDTNNNDIYIYACVQIIRFIVPFSFSLFFFPFPN